MSFLSRLSVVYPDPTQVKSRWFQVVLLGGWIVLATVLRLHHLTAKPPWTDEFSTLVFGLGNSFETVPLNQAIALETLLEPLRSVPGSTAFDAAHQLLQESNHPPLYFMLTHGWLQLFSGQEGYVSIWAARSLSALFGVVAVPAMYGLGWLTCRSRVVAHLAAGLMAVSPFGIYLAQEARHYTLAVLWIIVSLSCLVIAVRSLWHQQPLPLSVMLIWIGVNGLGLATHYFFLLTLLAELLVLIGAVAFYAVSPKQTWIKSTLWRIGGAIAGTSATGLVWLPFLLSIRQGDGLTRWIFQEGWTGLEWINPITQTLASLTSMLFLLPIQRINPAIAIGLGCFLAVFSVRVVWLVFRTLRRFKAETPVATALRTLALFAGGAIAIILLLTYGLNIDLALVFRYHFIYFPAILLLVAAGLAPHWHPLAMPDVFFPLGCEELERSGKRPHGQRGLIGLILLLGLLGSLTVTYDFGYRKVHHPDRVVEVMAERHEAPMLVAISHQTHGQTGRLMALAWEMRSPAYATIFSSFPESPTFFLDHQDCTQVGEQNCNQPSKILQQTISVLPKPHDLWLINYEGEAGLGEFGCKHRVTKRTDGYKYQEYECR